MKEFFKKMWIKAIEFLTKSEEKAKKITKLAIKVTNAVKTVVDSPFTDIGAFALKKAIPGEGDDVIIDMLLSKAETELPKLIAQETLVLGLLENASLEEKANFVLNKIKFASDDAKNEFYHKFCVRTVLFLSDGNVSYGEAVILAEMVYQELKKNNQL